MNIFLTSVLGAEKNRLIEMVILSTHNICFGKEIRKIIIKYKFLSGGIGIHMLIGVFSCLIWSSPRKPYALVKVFW